MTKRHTIVMEQPLGKDCADIQKLTEHSKCSPLRSVTESR